MKRILVAVLVLSIILASGCLNAPAELKKEKIIDAIENTESATLHLDENLTINATVPEKNLTVTYNLRYILHGDFIFNKTGVANAFITEKTNIDNTSAHTNVTVYVAPDNRTFLKFSVHINRKGRVYNFTQNWTDYWKIVREYGLEKEVKDTINEVKNSKVNYDLIEKMLQERNITFKRDGEYYIAEFNVTYSEVLRALNETNPIVEFFNTDQDFKKLGFEVNYTDEGGYMRVKVNKNGFPTEVYWVTGMKITLIYPKKNQKITFFIRDTLLLRITNINKVKVEPPKDLMPLLNNSTSS